MSLRFLLDEDVSHRVAQGLRQRGIDAVSVHEIGRGNRRLPDEEQLIYAAKDGRVLVTYNRSDYQVPDAAWRVRGETHAGILWCAEKTIARSAIGELVRGLEAVASQNDSLEGFCMPLPRSQP